MSKAEGSGWACSRKEAGNRKESLLLWINGNNMSSGLELSFLPAVSVPLALPPTFSPAEGVLKGALVTLLLHTAVTTAEAPVPYLAAALEDEEMECKSPRPLCLLPGNLGRSLSGISISIREV